MAEDPTYQRKHNDAEEQSDPSAPGVTPGQAEGSRSTIEEALKRSDERESANKADAEGSTRQAS